MYTFYRCLPCQDYTYDYITQSNIQLDMFKTQNGEIALKKIMWDIVNLYNYQELTTFQSVIFMLTCVFFRPAWELFRLTRLLFTVTIVAFCHVTILHFKHNQYTFCIKSVPRKMTARIRRMRKDCYGSLILKDKQFWVYMYWCFYTCVRFFDCWSLTNKSLQWLLLCQVMHFKIILAVWATDNFFLKFSGIYFKKYFICRRNTGSW